MLNWKRLRLYEDFFYSSGNHENAAETVRFFGETADDFIAQNRADLESFCLHKNIGIRPEQAVFRTVFEDGQTAYQLWIPLKTD